MDEELELINKNLNRALAKLKSSQGQGASADLQSRKEKIAKLIRLHLHHVQSTVVTLRRRAQQRTRRRLKMMRSFFMQQMMEMHSNYMQMFALLRLKQADSDDEESEVSGTEEEVALPTDFPAFDSRFFEDVIPELSEEEFLSTLHVTRGTFETLCKQLAPTLRIAEELSRKSPTISTEKCVALALYFLASGERLSLIAERFAVPRPRTIKCLKVFCNAVMSTLGRALRQLPQNPVDCHGVAEGFQRESNMPPALIGVLGVCSIPIRANGDVKHSTSGSVLRMEYLLDDRMLFRELQLGCGARATLVPMFSHAPNNLSNLPKFRINNRPVPAFVLAPVYQNYPLRPWLLQRYSDPIAPHEHDFNEVAEHLQELSDCALHRLMSRWSFLSQPLDISFHTASCIITAAAVLHNLLEELSEPHLLEWGNAVDVSKFRAEPLADILREDSDFNAALEVRDFLARTISSTEI